MKSSTSGGSPKKKHRGKALYRDTIFSEQMRRVLAKHSASHALALLMMHRLTSGYAANREKTR